VREKGEGRCVEGSDEVCGGNGVVCLCVVCLCVCVCVRGGEGMFEGGMKGVIRRLSADGWMDGVCV
jgi:hypothetical protein